MKYIDNEDFKLDKTLGYMYVYSPTHELANAAGKVYKHRYLASIKMGRIITKEEVVHHIDGNKLNNSLDNLAILSNSEHSILHQLEKGNASVEITCEICNTSFFRKKSEVRHVYRNYCSDECFREGSRKFTISSTEMIFNVWTAPTTVVASKLNVSDVAINKRCKKLGIDKPPRGFWRKVKTGLFTEVLIPENVRSQLKELDLYDRVVCILNMYK